MRQDGDKLRLNRDPRPHVAVAERPAFVFRNVLRLRVNELPDFINLDTTRPNTLNRAILIGRTRRAKVRQQLKNSLLGHVGHPCSGVDADAIYQGRYHLCALAAV
jgi:hypothetical protein